MKYYFSFEIVVRTLELGLFIHIFILKFTKKKPYKKKTAVLT